MILADFLASRSGAPAGREAFLLAFPGEIFYNGTRQKIREVLSMASIHEHTLSNGMQLLCCPLPHLHSIEFGVYLRGGHCMKTGRIRAFAIYWSTCASAAWGACPAGS